MHPINDSESSCQGRGKNKKSRHMYAYNCNEETHCGSRVFEEGFSLFNSGMGEILVFLFLKDLEFRPRNYPEGSVVWNLSVFLSCVVV